MLKEEGEFPDLIYQNITRSDNFVIILTEDAMDRCLETEGDWIRRELAAAIRQDKNIIPITCMGVQISIPSTR